MRNWFSWFAGWEGAQDNRGTKGKKGGESQAASSKNSRNFLFNSNGICALSGPYPDRETKVERKALVQCFFVTLTLNLGEKMPSVPWRGKGRWEPRNGE